MPYLHVDKTLIFTSSAEVIAYYTALIEKLISQLEAITSDNHQVIRTEMAELRYQLSEQLKNFGHDQIGEYFTNAIEKAESDPELYALSNAYETWLTAELQRIKKALHTLRTT